MLKIIREIDDPELMERVWTFRHTRFVEELGWEELRRGDCRERDEFDTEGAMHVVLVHDDEVVGYSRLLPTIEPHLTSRFCLQSTTKPPSGPRVLEWSRCATKVDAPDIDGHRASDMLMTGVLECLVALDVDAVVFLTYLPVVKMMRRRGYPIQHLDTLNLANGDRVEAVFSKLPADLLPRHMQKHGIAHSLLDWGFAAATDRFDRPTAA